jgi:hypothetical protein
MALDGRSYFPTLTGYDRHGHRDDLGAGYSGVLGSRVFPDLGLLEAGFGMPAGSASLGRSQVSMEYGIRSVDVSCQYGLTDRLSLGASLCFSRVAGRVTARVDTSGATLGFNPDFGLPGDRFGTPLIPVAEGGLRDDAMAAGLVQDMLSGGYGYRRLESWSGSGPQDLEIGARWRCVRSPDWRLALTGGVRLPTGAGDDPDDLVDLSLGAGCYSLLFRAGGAWTGVEGLEASLSLAFDLNLSCRETVRVPDDIDQPVTANRTRVSRDPGDTVGLEATVSWRLCELWSVHLAYEYGRTFQDRIDGEAGFDCNQLESASGGDSHVAIVGVSLSFLESWSRGGFPLPAGFHLEYRERFSGRNVFGSRCLEFGVDCLF